MLRDDHVFACADGRGQRRRCEAMRCDAPPAVNSWSAHASCSVLECLSRWMAGADWGMEGEVPSFLSYCRGQHGQHCIAVAVDSRPLPLPLPLPTTTPHPHRGPWDATINGNLSVCSYSYSRAPGYWATGCWLPAMNWLATSYQLIDIQRRIIQDSVVHAFIQYT